MITAANHEDSDEKIVLPGGLSMAVPSRILIKNAELIGAPGLESTGWILIDGKVIKALGSGLPPLFPEGSADQVLDATGLYALPGFIDAHVHGAVNQDVMDGSAEGLRTMARFFVSRGVTAFLPTTLTAGVEKLQAALSNIRRVMDGPPCGAAVLGAHLEGPYLNVARCGAQAPGLIRRALQAEAQPLLESGIVRLLALAPEFPENLWLIDECVRRGITVAAGHTAATYEEMQTGAAHGLSQVTHCFNAMGGLNHRQPGTVGAALAMDSIRCELIADNIHVHPAVQRILAKVKGPERILLITDAVRGAGMPEGEYEFDGRPALIRAGAVRLPDGTLAGSVLTMDKALQNFVRASGEPLAKIWKVSSLTPAQALGVADRKGSLEAGKDADIVLLDMDLKVKATIAEGRLEFTEL